MDSTRTNNLLELLREIGLKELNNAKLLSLVDEALTHVSAGRSKNFERLEFLGDAVLRLAATEFIDHHYPDLPVGSCSNLRAQLVSDRWLAQLGEPLPEQGPLGPELPPPADPVQGHPGDLPVG